MRPTTVYRCFDADDRLLYVGCSIDWPRRMYEHDYARAWFRDVARVALTHYASAEEAIGAEQTAIEHEDPLHNVDASPGRHRTPRGYDEFAARKSAFYTRHEITEDAA